MIELGGTIKYRLFMRLTYFNYNFLVIWNIFFNFALQMTEKRF